MRDRTLEKLLQQYTTRLARMEKRLNDLGLLETPVVPDFDTTPDFTSINVGSASGASTGEIRTSGNVYPGDPNSWIRNYRHVLANNAVAQIHPTAAIVNRLIFVLCVSDAAWGVYTLRGGGLATTELLDGIGIYTPTAGSASSVNIYYSVGNARYEIENKRGGSRNIDVFFFGNNG